VAPGDARDSAGTAFGEPGWASSMAVRGAAEVVVSVLGLDLAASWRTGGPNLTGRPPSARNANGRVARGTVMGSAVPSRTGSVGRHQADSKRDERLN